MRRHSILRNTVLLTLTNLSLRSVSLLFQVYLSGAIGAVGMGKMQLTLTAGGFAMTLGNSGVRVAAMNLTARACGRDNPAEMKKAILSCLLYALAASLAAGALLCACAKAIALHFVGDIAVRPALLLLGISLPFTCLTAVFSGYYTARGKIRQLVTVDVLERVASIFLTVFLLKRFARGDMARIFCSVIGGSSMATLGSFLLLSTGLFRDLRTIHGSRSIPMAKPLFSLCVPLALSDYLRSGLSSLEQFLIPHGLRLYGGGADAAMGHYGTISGMVFPVLMFPAALFYSLSDLLVPELSRCRARGNQRQIKIICSRCLRIGFVFSAMVAGLMYLLAPQLGLLLYQSADAGRYLRVFSLTILMLYPDALTDGMLKGLGEQVASVRYNTVCAVCDVVFLYFLLPRWGIGGFVFTFAVTHGLNFFLSLRRLMTVAEFSPDLEHSLFTMLASATAALLTLILVPPLAWLPSLLLAAGVFLGAFFLLCYYLDTFRPRELLSYLPKKKRSVP